MKQVLVLAFLISSFFLSSLAKAQSTNQVPYIQLSGQVLSLDSLKPITDVNIINKNSGFGTSSDSKGLFIIKIHKTDTIVFSAVGYEKYSFYLDASSQANNPTIQVMMVPTSYELKEVVVRPYKSLEDFKKEFLALELPENPDLQLPQISEIKVSGSVVLPPGGGVAVVGPFSALYDRFGKKGKEQRKLQSLLAQQFDKNQYVKKFNKELVGRVTGLKDMELEEFMKYCQLSPAFVKESNEYDIVLAINGCFKSFQEREKKAN